MTVPHHKPSYSKWHSFLRIISRPPSGRRRENLNSSVKVHWSMSRALMHIEDEQCDGPAAYMDLWLTFCLQNFHVHTFLSVSGNWCIWYRIWLKACGFMNSSSLWEVTLHQPDRDLPS